MGSVDARNRRAFLIAAALTMLCWGAGFVDAEPSAAKPTPLPDNAIAYVLFGGNAAADKAPASQGIANFVDWALEAGPRFKRHGVKRVHLQNPGGLWPGVDAADGREMRVDQWLLAERAGHRFADRDQLRTAFGILRHYGVSEIIVYIGSPTQLPDPERQLPECVAACLDAGPGVSIGLDAIFQDGMEPGAKRPNEWREQWRPQSPYTRSVVALRQALHAHGGKLYAEPRLSAEHLAMGLGRLVDGTVDTAVRDRQANPLELAKQPGETIRLTNAGNHTGRWPEIDHWVDGPATPMLRTELNWGPLMDRKEAK